MIKNVYPNPDQRSFLLYEKINPNPITVKSDITIGWNMDINSRVP